MATQIFFIVTPNSTSPVGGFYCVRWKLSQDEGPESSPGMAFFWELKPSSLDFLGWWIRISEPLFLRQQSRDLQRLESKKNPRLEWPKCQTARPPVRTGAAVHQDQVRVKHRRFHLIALITPISEKNTMRMEGRMHLKMYFPIEIFGDFQPATLVDWRVSLTFCWHS